MGRKIIDTAASYGIGAEDIILDGLCMTVSADSKGALTTLETVRRIRDELGSKSVLGVSNISFGLPQREIINAAFFTMAMEAGLNAAIINPNSEAMMPGILQLQRPDGQGCPVQPVYRRIRRPVRRPGADHRKIQVCFCR